MAVLKWVLIILGSIVLAGLIVIVGTFYWASTVQSVKLTEADLKIGGDYPAEERQELLDICAKKRKPGAEGDDRCVCIADRAGKDFSRFERLVFIASFEGNATRVVALTKGLIDSGIAQSRIDELQKDSKTRIDGLLKACGYQQ
ncbi:MAG: hypothetical protein ACXWJH_01805 [Hyphomicrobium sp.]|jgi:hypothetical protein